MIAEAYGASRCGAGMSSITSSVREGSASTNSRIVSTARWNGSGGRASRGVTGTPGDLPDARPCWGDRDALSQGRSGGPRLNDHGRLRGVADHDRHAALGAGELGALDAVTVGAGRLFEAPLVVTDGAMTCEGHPLVTSLDSAWDGAFTRSHDARHDRGMSLGVSRRFS